MSDSIGLLIAQCCRAHRNRADLGLSELGLHVGQEMFLFQLWREDGQTQSQLAGCMCIEAPTLSKMVQRMESAGFIERKPDADDARVSRVYLTERGRSLQQPVLAMWRDMEERTLAGLNYTEQMLLRRLLLQIRTNIS
jgi:DNA-binding MarR family transcriptional regulator